MKNKRPLSSLEKVKKIERERKAFEMRPLIAIIVGVIALIITMIIAGIYGQQELVRLCLLCMTLMGGLCLGLALFERR